jgi:AraC-like DNA-binding protein
LLRGLPTVIHIPGEQGRLAPGFADIVALSARESAVRRPGTEVVLRRLTEMLFIRIWAEQQAPAGGGWLAVLRDPAVGGALGLIHQSPGRRWTVQELVGAVALSRSAFSARFTRLAGEPPMTYLTRWRMHTAARLLKTGTTPGRIAQQLGYDSEVAFRKAFRREVGIPGQIPPAGMTQAPAAPGATITIAPQGPAYFLAVPRSRGRRESPERRR